MSRFAKVNLLEVEDSVAGRVEGLERSLSSSVRHFVLGFIEQRPPSAC